MIGKNNPLNIRTSGHYSWNGQTGATRGFCDFEDVALCRRAGAYLLMRSYRRAKAITIREVITRWAPAFENNTNAYIEYVCKRTGLKADTDLVFCSDYASLLAAMEIFEQGVPTSKREEYFATARASYMYVINNYCIKKYEVKG